jgi:thioredoxin reductase (NADPH)
MAAEGSGVTIDTDVAVIGGGPVGLFAVFECGMLRMKSVVIDTLEAIGGQCTALYPEKPIYDIPAHPAIEGAALISLLEAQAAPFSPRYLLGRRVETLRPDGGHWLLGTSAGDTVRAKAVIIAAGAGAFGPNRPPLEGLPGYEATGGVRYLVARREEFRGKRVVIAGGGDSAVDWALSLKDIAAKVIVVHRRPKFRAAPETAAQLEAAAARDEIELAIPYQLHGLAGDGSTLTGVELATLKGETKLVEADHLLAFFGLSMELGPIADWGLGLDRHHIGVTPATLETNLPGIYAIGDIATYPGKLKLILQGFSEAAMAAHAIHPRVFPGEALHFEYSTSKGVPAA